MKSSKISINEDLSRGMQMVYNRLRANEAVKDTWAWNGKLFFKTHDEKTHRIRYGQTVQDVITGNRDRP